MVRIRNKRTGEIKEVDENELGGFGLGQTAQQPQQMGTSVTQRGAGQLGGLDPESLRSMFLLLSLQDPSQAGKYKSILELAAPPKISEAERKAEVSKQEAGRIMTQLENLYYGTETGSLAYGRGEGINQYVEALRGNNADLANYMAQRTSAKVPLARALGEVGNLTASEQSAAVKGVPTGLSTPEEAEKFFASTRVKFGLALSEIPKAKATVRPTTEPVGLDKKERTLLQRFVESESLPVWAGITTGAIAAPVTGGLGSIPAAGVGGGAVYALQDLLRPFAGIEQQRPEERLAGGAKAFKKGAISRATQMLLGKIMKGFKPSKALTGVRDIAGGRVPGTPISGEQAASAALEAAEGAATTVRPGAQKLALQAIEKLGGKDMAVKEALRETTKAQAQAYKSGQLGEGAAQLIENAIAQNLRGQISGASPLTGYLTSATSKTIGVEQALKKLLGLLGRGVGYGGAGAIGGYLGGKAAGLFGD